MSALSPSANASAPMPVGATVTIADQSCNSGAHGVVAVNALNCNNVQVGNDFVDVVGAGKNSNAESAGSNGQQNSSNQNGSSVTYKDQSCNSGAHGVVAVNALNCNNVEIANDLVDVVGIGANLN